MERVFYIFTDASASAAPKVAIAGYIYLEYIGIKSLGDCSKDEISQDIQSKIVYEIIDTHRSNVAEINAAILALKALKADVVEIDAVHLYTDCQSLCDLLGSRKERLIRDNFKTKSGTLLNHSVLYQDLFSEVEGLSISVNKVKGHCQSKDRISVQEIIFSILDKQVRSKLRELIKNEAV